MKKEGLKLQNLQPLLYNNNEQQNWSLCVGAGISQPLFPSWLELIQEIYKKKIGNEKYIENVISEYNLDSILQSIYTLSNEKYDDFLKDLSDCLYERIKKYFSKNEWPVFCKLLFETNSAHINKEEWFLIEEKFSQIPKTTAFELAEILCSTITTDLEPYSVLTFNAESYLQACTNYLLHKKKKFNNQSGTKKYLDVITSSIGQKNKKRLPFYYCHGLMPAYINNKQVNSKISFSDKLIFLEEEYINQTNISFSWQASSFCEAIKNSTVVFIGVSLTDPNMRRWLSWIYQAKLNDIKHYNKNISLSTSHYWINKLPNNTQEKEMLEAIVANLGIRIIWIKEWTEVSLAMKKLLNIKPKVKRVRVTRKTKKN